MENECEALPGVAYPGVRDNRSTVNTKTGYDDDESVHVVPSAFNVTVIVRFHAVIILTSCFIN